MAARLTGPVPTFSCVCKAGESDIHSGLRQSYHEENTFILTFTTQEDSICEDRLNISEGRVVLEGGGLVASAAHNVAGAPIGFPLRYLPCKHGSYWSLTRVLADLGQPMVKCMKYLSP